MGLKLIYFLFMLVIMTSSLRAHAEDSDERLFKVSIEQFTVKNFRESAKILLQLVAKNPKKALYWFNLGNSYFMLGRHSDAARSFAAVERLKSPLTPAAQFYRSKALSLLGKKEEARKILNALVLSSVTPSSIRDGANADLVRMTVEKNLDDTQFADEALNSYQSGRYLESLEYLNRIREPDIDHLMLKGMLLYKLGRLAESNSLFNAIKIKAPDREKRELIETLKDQVNGISDRDRTFWLFVDLAAGANSNVYYQADYDSPKAASVLRAISGVGGQFFRSGPFSFFGSYLFEWDETAQSGDLKSISNQLSSFMSLDLPKNQLQVGPVVKFESWAGQAAIIKPSIRARYRLIGQVYDLGLEFDFSQILPQSSTYSYLAGPGTTARVYTGMIKAPVYGQVFLIHERQQSGDLTYSDGSVLPVAFEGFGIGGRAIYKMSSMWLVSGNLEYKSRSYSTPAVPNSTYRVDYETALGVRGIRVFSDSFSAYGSLGYTRNRSNLGPTDVKDENYLEYTIMTGVTWDFD